jgi:hypothetical protein
MEGVREKVLRRIFRPQTKTWREAGDDCKMRKFINCTLQ